MTGQDALVLILIADGEKVIPTERFVSKLLDPLYLVMGASIKKDDVSPLNPPKIMVDIVIDTSYRNT